MSKRLSKLTSTQHEILSAVWDRPDGATVTQIWEQIATTRSVTRTTILNLVDRLEKRGWLSREKESDGFRYRATVDRAATAQLVVTEFVDDFFSGSASELVTSLLGSKRLRPSEVAKLRDLLSAAPPNSKPKK
ncbi:MAG TPA: BlaI/MecI/CopY family transcriptional regulator [Planctomycetaceae bacterium]